MKRIVIESPYAGDIERNEAYARRAMKHALSKHEAPFLSHMLYTQPGVLNDLDPRERALGITAGFAWGCHADLIAVYCDYGISNGMLSGITNGIRCKTPIVFRMIGKNPR